VTSVASSDSRMAVSAPSATAMTKRLAELGLVERAPYRGVVLTDEGRRGALEVLRHHRLLERYLVDRLGLSLDEVHVEADRLEHALSEELEALIDASLGYPTHDPHGDPIPDAELHIDTQKLGSLEALEEGREATVRRVPDGDPGLLRYLDKLGLVPGRRVRLRTVAPFQGPLTVEIDGRESAISRDLAARISVA
jgi:DtxR family transcriptional regulator, Mn-dependent transcriptional regulator